MLPSIRLGFFPALFCVCTTSLFFPRLVNAQEINISNINIVNTPVPGSGHDYLKMLNETVNPASGALSIRIEAPVPHQRGEVNFPFYIFGYDSGDAATPSAQITTEVIDSDGLVQQSVLPKWTDSSVNLLGGYSVQPSGLAAGMFPGGFIANTGIDQTYFQTTSVDITISSDPEVIATCQFYSGYTYVDPFATRHSMSNVGWIVQNGEGSGNQGCAGAQIGAFNTSWQDAEYAITLTGTHDITGQSTGLQITVADEHGRSFPSTFGSGVPQAGAGAEDSNGNASQAPATTTFSGQTASVSVSGIGNTYKYGFINATRTYTAKAVLNTTASAGSNCASSFPTEPQSFEFLNTITLPNSTQSNLQQYVFGFDSTYGLVNSVTYPTHASVTYSWGVDPNSESLALGGPPASTQVCWYQHDWPRIMSRVVSFNGVTSALEQDFQYTTNWGSSTTQWQTKTTTVTTKDCLRAPTPGTCSTAPKFLTTYTYIPAPVCCSSFSGQSPVENTIVYNDWNGALLKTVTKNWDLTNSIPPQLLSECTTLPNGLTSGKFYTYAAYGVVSDIKEYDYGILSSTACAQGAASPTATPTRETTATYQSFPAMPIPGLMMEDRPKVVQVSGNGTLLAETDLFYDAYGSGGITPVTATSHDDTNYPASYTNRGNVTSKTVKCFIGSTACTNATSSYTFDETGQILSMTDPCGNATCSDMAGTNHTTNYSYSDSYTVLSNGANIAYAPSGKTNAFLTQITDPLGHMQQFSYDYNSSQLTAALDQNDITAKRSGTTYIYNDVFGRLTQANYPDQGQTTYNYVDSSTPTVTTSKLISSSPQTVMTTVDTTDGVGHLTQTELTTDPDGATFTNTSYDGLGRAYQVYNPTRTEPTGTLTTYTYDALGRTTNVVQPDGSVVVTAYSSNQATVTDEVGVQRKTQTDAFGRLTNVWEASNFTGFNFETDYQYDALNNLLCAVQKGTSTTAFTSCAASPTTWRPRSFVYDSLSRLTTATNPESGTISYAYDANGNVATRIMPQANQTGTAQTTTTYKHDALNRLLLLTHTNPSGANSAYAYDGLAISGCPGVAVPTITSPTNLVGRRSAMCSQESASSFSYDPMGRIVSEARTNGLTSPPPITFTTGYQYNKDGSLNKLTYPSGDVVTYTVGGAGRVTSVSDATNNFVALPATLPMYSPNGAIAAMTEGSGIVTKNTYDSRFRPTLLSAGPASGSVFSVSYNYDLRSNVIGVLNNLDSTRSTQITYDALNRITQAETVNTTSANCWGESYTIDPWANLTNIGPAPGISGSCSTETLNAGPATAANGLNGYCYDAAGNLLSTTCGTPTFNYDPENRLYNPTAPYTYLYDADGVRIRKAASATVGTFYWPGPGREYLTETNGSGVINEEYIFFNGERIARIDRPSGIVHYYFSDDLQSASVITGASGGVAEQYFYYPYGGTASSSGSDTNHYLFTGKERDNDSGEFGLDYFGARYYGSNFGRFTTPDWNSVAVPIPYAQLSNPQTLNLYGYVTNNPLTLRDPDGHCDDSGFWCRLGQRIENAFKYGDAVTNSQLPAMFAQQRQWLQDNLRNRNGSPLSDQQRAQIAGLSGDDANSLYRHFSLQQVGIDDHQFDTMFAAAIPGTLYRGGTSMEARPGIDVRIDPQTGLIKPGYGLSLNESPDGLGKFGGAHEIDQSTVPPELEIRQQGRTGHYEIVARESMTIERFNELAKQIKFK
jgi:RHS repeat-associated protein